MLIRKGLDLDILNEDSNVPWTDWNMGVDKTETRNVCFMGFLFCFIKFIGVTLINTIIQVSKYTIL